MVRWHHKQDIVGIAGLGREPDCRCRVPPCLLEYIVRALFMLCQRLPAQEPVLAAGDHNRCGCPADGGCTFHGAGEQASGAREGYKLLGKGFPAGWPEPRPGTARQNDGPDIVWSLVVHETAAPGVSVWGDIVQDHPGPAKRSCPSGQWRGGGRPVRVNYLMPAQISPRKAMKTCAFFGSSLRPGNRRERLDS